MSQFTPEVPCGTLRQFVYFFRSSGPPFGCGFTIKGAQRPSSRQAILNRCRRHPAWRCNDGTPTHQHTNPPIHPRGSFLTRGLRHPALLRNDGTPTGQFTNWPIYQLADLPTGQFTNLPTCQFANLPIYQFTNLPIPYIR